MGLLVLASCALISPASALVVELDDVAPDRIERQRAFVRGTLPPSSANVETLGERLAAKGLVEGAPVMIRIFKLESELELWMRKGDAYVQAATYPICHWTGSLGPKLREGDKQSPEGFYTIGQRQMRHRGRWQQAFNLGFPNLHDARLRRTGSYILVHGGCSSTGCYAMTQEVQREIYRLASAALGHGQERFQVHIFPFRMTEANMQRFAPHQWSAFWRDLKAGYDAFEQTRRPPHLNVCGHRYVVTPAVAGEEVDAPLRPINAAKVAAAGLDPEVCRIEPERSSASEQTAALSDRLVEPDAPELGRSSTVFRVERQHLPASAEDRAPRRKAGLPQRLRKRDASTAKRARLSSTRRAYRELLAESYRRDRSVEAARRYTP
jgi:murein L,D-transpeptidase YafK